MHDRQVPKASGGPPPTDPDDRRAIRSLLAGYWAFGQYWGLWVILVYEYQRLHGLSEGRLGLLYTALSLVAILTMLLVAPRLRSLPLSATVPVALLGLAVGSFATGFLTTGTLVIGFLLVGVGNGLIDVYLNVAAQRAEAATDRPVLQWLHASYALGGVTGAALAGAIIAIDIDFRLGFAFVSVVLVLTAAWNARTAPAAPGPAGSADIFSVSALFSTPGLWVAALVVLFAFLVEGSMDTWSGLYLREELGASAPVAAAAFMAFSGAIFLGRMFAGRVLFGLGPRSTILISGVGAAVSGLVAVITDQTAVVAVAFLFLGFTISAAAPAGFSLTRSIDEDPTDAITAVTTVGYSGFVWSPPLLGYVAQAFDLRAAMAVIVVATLGIIAAGLLAPRSRR
jgi:predicted MFS family arabinose efflux permease